MAVKLTIDPSERAQLGQLARTTKDAKTAIRVRAILALGNGHTVREVAEILLLDEDTITTWRNKFKRRKLFTDWLATNCRGYAGRLTTEQEQQIEQYVSDELITDSKQVASFIKERYGSTSTVDGVTKLLHRLGFIYKQTTLVPGRLDEQMQARFKEEYEQLRDTLPDDEVITFADGVHPTHNVVAVRAWIKKGQEKRIPTNTGRQRLNINGALDLVTMRIVTHFSDTINGEETIQLYDKLQAAYSDKQKIHVIEDNARYYKNKTVQAYLARDGCRIAWCIIFRPTHRISTS